MASEKVITDPIARVIVIEITYDQPVTESTVRAVIEANSGYEGQTDVRGALLVRREVRHEVTP